jgi:TusE/DsrC/DsvC family sulfur relay protein
MGIEVNGTTYETDEEGYLVNLADWNEEIGKVLAKGENVEMTDSHWEVVNFLRDYYNEYQIAPAVRVLTKAIGKQLGPEKGNSKYLYELFPYGPAKQACKIAGLAQADRLRLAQAAAWQRVSIPRAAPAFAKACP